MPYRHAHWYLLALFPLAALAFWPQYLSVISDAPMEFHAHGVTSTLWLMLLAAQSWTIHHRQRQAHRALGLTSLALFPLFLAGGVGIFIGMAERYVEGASLFYTLYAAKLAWLDVVAVGAIAYFYFEGLRNRSKVHLHSRYLLATAIFLLPPILGRLAPLILGLEISGPADFGKLGIGFQFGNIVTAAIAFFLAWRSGKHGRPFHIAGFLMLVASLLFQFIGPMAWWETFFAHAAEIPSAPLAIAAALSGILVAYAGWIGGRRPALMVHGSVAA